MFFKGKKEKSKTEELKTENILDENKKENTERLSTELIFENLSSDQKESVLPDEGDIPFWDEKNIRQQISTDIGMKYKSVSGFAVECSVDRSLITQWVSMKKNISRDRLLCILITLYGNEEDCVKKINDILKSLKDIDSLHVHNLRDFTIISGLKKHKSLDEIDDELGNKQLAGFENLH